MPKLDVPNVGPFEGVPKLVVALLPLAPPKVPGLPIIPPLPNPFAPPPPRVAEELELDVKAPPPNPVTLLPLAGPSPTEVLPKPPLPELVWPTPPPKSPKLRVVCAFNPKPVLLVT